MRKRAIANLGVLFLVAGIGMLAAEYAGGPSLDVPDVYASSNLSSATTISSTCSPQGTTFTIPTALALVAVTTSTTSGGVVIGTPTATLTGGVGASGVTSESTLATTSNSLVGTNSESITAMYNTTYNGFRMRRDVQCLGLPTPFAQLTMKLDGALVAPNVIAFSGTENATSGFTSLTTSAQFIKGSAATNDGVTIDTDLSELLIGGSVASTGWGWAFQFNRLFSISAPASGVPGLVTESQLNDAAF